MIRRLGLRGVSCFMLAAFAFLVMLPATSSANVQDKIDVLQAELEKLKGEQLEIKKQATEAAAALPTFSYRPGSGILMEAADKSWSIRLHNRIHFWWLFRDGEANSATGREGLGELFGRRIRPTFFYCVNDCLYEFEASLDFDSGDAVALQRATAFIHLEKLNPWMPTFYFGLDSPAAWNRRASSASGAQLDYDILTRSTGNTFSNGWNYALLWEDKPLDSIGIPGRIEWFNLVAGAGPGNASDGVFVNSDKKSYSASLAISPFSQLKSKWLRGLELSWGALFCNFDPDGSNMGGCDDFQLRETDGPNRATLFDANITPGEDTMLRLHGSSVRWRVGPYQLLATLHFGRAEDTSVRTRDWLIGHELYVWSPKGFLTGSSSTPNSILIGTHFERADGECGSTCQGNHAAQFTRNTIKLYSAHITYWIQRGIGVGVHWNHYDAKNIPAALQDDLGVRSVGVAGRGGSWDNLMAIFRWEF